jgi:SM-20-related protein
MTLLPDTLHDEPFRWGYAEDALDPARAAELRRTFPSDGYWDLRRHDGEKYMRFLIRPLVPLGLDRVVLPDSLAPAWRELAGELLSPSYRSRFERVLGQSLDGAELELSVWRWGPESELGPHLDIPRKIASQVLYFNESWDAAWGGCLRILRSADEEDVFAELPPALGSASVIVRSESSWHAVPRVRHDAAAERLSVVATWQQPGTTSPFWTVEEDGGVRCHTTGASPASA